MPIAASIEFPQADAAALFSQMDRAQRVLGRSLGKSVLMAANFVARSLGASTRLSDKYREFHPVVGSQTSRGRQEYEAIRPYYAQRKKRFFAWNDAEAKESRFVKIGRRGLAKATWAAVGRRGGFGGGAAGSHAVKGLAAKFGTMERHLTGEDPFAVLLNRLYYAESALQGGPEDVSSALARAARNMERDINQKAAKRLGMTSP